MNGGKYDVIITGSGPSGAIAAYFLAKNGLSVAILEKEKLPRYKTCGGGVVARALNLIPFELNPVFEKAYNKVALNFPVDNLRFEITKDQPFVYMTMRDSLDHLLVKRAVEKGARLCEKEKVKSLEWKENEIHIQTNHTRFNCRYLIAADGALSRIAKMVGWKDSRTLIPALEYETTVSSKSFERFSRAPQFDIGVAPHGYGWVFPKKNHLSIGVGGLSPRKLRINLKNFASQYFDVLRLNGSVQSISAHGYQIPISPRKEGFVKKNVLLTCDAGGFADPVTAEGISNALLSGKLAAFALYEGFNDPEQVKSTYHQKLDKQILSPLKTGRFLSRIFYGHKKFRYWAFRYKGQLISELFTGIFTGERNYPVSQAHIAKAPFKLLLR